MSSWITTTFRPSPEKTCLKQDFWERWRLAGEVSPLTFDWPTGRQGSQSLEPGIGAIYAKGHGIPIARKRD
jgi:hypothetical protein